MLYKLFLLLALCGSAAAAPNPPREEIIPLGTDTRDAAAPPRFGSSGLRRAELLGQARLGNRSYPVSIPAPTCNRRSEKVAALRLRVLRGPAILSSLEVRFADGARQRIDLGGRNLAPNSESAWLFFAPHACVRRLTLEARNSFLSPDPSVVQVFALVGEEPDPEFLPPRAVSSGKTRVE